MHALEIEHQVSQLGADGKLSVIPLRGPEQYGKLVSAGAGSFTFYDVDAKANVTFSFAEVDKVKAGYGGYNTVQHRHTDRTRGVLIGVGIAVLLTVLVVAGARS